MRQILIVDDDPSQLFIRETFLRNAGMAVNIATSVESALAFLRAAGDKIGLVITDHFLPGRSGADLVREVRLTLPSMPVVVLSGMPGIESEYEGLKVSVCLKPMRPEELIRIARESLAA